MANAEVLPGVRSVGTAISNAYLVDGGEGLVAIDTGVPGRGPALIRAVEAAGRGAQDIRDIIVTHYHFDHAGGLAAVAKASGARVHVHAIDAGVVRAGGVPPSARPVWPGSGLILRLVPQRRIDPAAVDVELAGGEHLAIAGGLEVIHSPGHTRGHISVLWPRSAGRGVLFAGDAAVNLLGLRTPFVAEDRAAIRDSIRRLAALDFDTAVFGHGNPIRGRAVAQFRRLAERLAR